MVDHSLAPQPSAASAPPSGRCSHETVTRDVHSGDSVWRCSSCQVVFLPEPDVLLHTV